MKPVSKETRMQLIRALEAELVFVRKPLPMGKEGVVIRYGELRPEGTELRTVLLQFGTAARPGDRARITSMDIKDNKIVLEINGGPVKKKKWYQRVQVSVNNTTSQAPGTDINAHGSKVELQFEDFVPEMTAQQVKEMFSVVLDFSNKTPAQAYAESMPPQIRKAIKDHTALVGMNREMVIYAKGRPERRIREKEGETEYEEWIYGQPPKDVEFIRFVADEVMQVKIMKVDGEKIVRTQKEVFLDATGMPTTAQAPQPGQQPGAQPASATAQDQRPRPLGQPPTLRRPGEEPAITTVPSSIPNPSIPPPQTGPSTPPVGDPGSRPPN